MARVWQAVLGVPLAVGESGRSEQPVTQAVAPAVAAAQLDGQPHGPPGAETAWGEQPQRRWWWPGGTAQGRVVRSK